ncbi:MAG: helix-turn-helix transcriptional regulator [Bacteroidetes bacterium]|nr:helix-turn-helix transcriptional regulator [Bacteroidota bacterium]
MKGEVSTLGEIIKSKRLKIGLLQSDVAVKLGIDAPLLSKIEKGLRRLKREQIPKIASILNTDKEELLTIWLADQIYDVVKGEEFASEAIRVTEEKILYKCKAKTKYHHG